MALIGAEGDQPWPPSAPTQSGGSVDRYEVEANGFTTTMQLSDADAVRLGLKKAVDAKAAKAPANKNRKPSNKAVSVGATGGAE